MAGIYIHIPFCKQACYYCDFHFSTSLRNKESMLSAIKRELILRKNEFKESIETIYFGGGTPSLLNSLEIDSIIDLIRMHFQVTENPEITLEANPDDLSKEKLEELSKTPVNRLSIGVQSFFDEDLRYMNRAHNSKQAIDSMEHASKWFENISMDLIYGMPTLNEKRWEENLQFTFDFNVNHISSYALTVEPRTALDHFIRKGTYKAPSEKKAESHFKILQQLTKAEEFIQYEISNFGKKGYFSRHNTSYWKGLKYLGIGPSAHSFDGTRRSWNVSNNAKYLKSLEKDELSIEVEYLTVEDRINEMIMTGIRTIWGISIVDIVTEFGQDYKEQLMKQAQKHLQSGILYLREEQLVLRPEKYFLADGIASDMFLIKV
ncbi:radical SAM family heme chaperone HemW [Lutimonas zeaxanthinifaciens]|uniref:radical SAM family heme chaperone HemW n=1 Tax=Lutimonas zeaxanthinifaciens TaxID=3060215 RepID=UPI00265CAEDD|nr:radical SAM family heme chaperone HemW [Lutimonas sp. YSD2104]WKK65608.1 radical SAM family heme chaperone HemW [Lutimonas sp. YSD2104]